MKKGIEEQYASSENLESRMSIYQYAVDPITWTKWLAGQIDPASQVKILELGCGTGALWQDLRANFVDCEIHISDYSDGMLETARKNLGENEFKYEVINFHQIPYPDRSFDIIISNHNLYHALDLDVVLGEISRVLKDDGVFYATTNSQRHLVNLWELINFQGGKAWPKTFLPTEFDAETGLEILADFFQKIDQQFYRNELHITDIAAILNYFSSVQDKRIHQTIELSAKDIREKFDAAIRQFGYFRTGNEACLFICRKA